MNGLPSVIPPDLRELLNQLAKEIFASLNCHQVGTIVSFDAPTQLASISLNVKRQVYNQEQSLNQPPPPPAVVSYPVLVQCPVFVLSGGGGVLTMPIAAGDPCLVLFNDRNLDNWLIKGDTGVPNTDRMHSLADGMAIVGFYSLAAPVANYSSTDVELKFKGGAVKITSAGDVTVKSVHGGEMDLQTKVGLKNNATSLLTVLNALITALSSLDSVKTGGSASVAITAAQTEITSLLQ